MKKALFIIFMCILTIFAVGVYAIMIYEAITNVDMIERTCAVFGSNIIIALTMLFVSIIIVTRDKYD